MAGAFIVRGDDGEDYGPVSLDELGEWVRENRAGLGTTVKTDEPGSLWQPWQYYPELVALVAESRATATLSGVVLAPMGRRMVAFLSDLFLIFILLAPISVIVSFLCFPDVVVQMAVAYSHGEYTTTSQVPPSYAALSELILYGLPALYMAGFHAAHGRTPGKSILRLKVVDRHGVKPNIIKALLRGLVLSFTLVLFGIPLLYAFVDPQRRALHDMAAGTYVVEG